MMLNRIANVSCCFHTYSRQQPSRGCQSATLHCNKTFVCQSMRWSPQLQGPYRPSHGAHQAGGVLLHSHRHVLVHAARLQRPQQRLEPRRDRRRGARVHL